MSDELNLVRDLAVILISAGVFTIISKALKQPLILGYIIAGFLIGPHIDFFFNISSAESVHQWSEIGLIFMMFGLGLEFSFKKLLKVGSGALVTAGTKFIGVFVIGFVVGQAMSWTVMESVFLAGLMSMSSTAVVLKSYEDMGLKEKPYAGLVFGTLVVEDLIAILLMVLLSTLAVSNQFAGGELAGALAKLLFFIVLVFVVGIYLIPTMFRKARKYLNDEILLLVSIGLCFAMVTIASAAGFSSALGAFVMGSILAETIESEHIEKLVRPIKDLFGAIFFVSVGMMISPEVILQNWLIILLLAVLVIITHIFFSAAGILLTGNGLSNAVHTGFSLAQLGEFGFIIASVGVSLGVMRGFIYPVIVAVSVITTFTTPYMIKLAGPALALLQRKMPEKVLTRINQMERKTDSSAAERSDWHKLISAYLIRILLYSVILVAIMIASRAWLDPALDRLLPDLSEFVRNLISVGITLAVMSPLLYGLAVNKGSSDIYAKKLIKAKALNSWPILGLLLGRFFIALGFVLVVISTHFDLAGWTAVLLVLGGVVFFLISRSRVRERSTSMESMFFDNLNAKETLARKRTPVTSSIKSKMAGYDVHLESIKISEDSSFVGRKLMDIPIREESGANIIKITRGSHNILVPDGKEAVYPGDTLLAVGTGKQLSDLRKMISDSIEKEEKGEDPKFDIVTIDVKEDSYLCGRSLSSLGLRKFNCMVISVMRNEEMITNPQADLVFQVGDKVWIAGELTSANYLISSE
ncbi:MAG: cation:proton antiporter [Bacteroidales bacterium]|nr:cation:proton antiporter [Bacteroidales bacterium]